MMETKKIVREALLKQTERKYPFGCVMIYLDTDPKDWANLQKLVDEDDVYFGTEDNVGFGREMEPHATILYGIEPFVPDEEVEALIKQITKPKIKLHTISAFKNLDFEVLKFDIASKALHVLNTLFRTLPHTLTYPEYHPHATIAYLKKGKSVTYVEKMGKFVGINAIPSKVVYSKPDGTKKEYKL